LIVYNLRIVCAQEITAMAEIPNQPDSRARWDFSSSAGLDRLLFEEAADGVFIADPRLRFLAVNRRGAEFIGYPCDELLGMSIPELIPAEDLTRDPLNMDDLRKGLTVTKERRVRRKDGGLVSIEVSIRKIPDGNYLGIVRDITERRRVERELHQREEHLRRLTDNMVDAISQINAERRVGYCSPSVERLYGINPDDLIGRNAYDRVHPDDVEELRQKALAAIASRKKSLQAEYRYLHGNGNYIWVESSIRLLFGDDGEYAGAILGSRDITEKKLAEEDLRQANLVVENSPVVLFRWRAAAGWPVVMVSRNVIQFGYAPEELLSGAVPFAALVHPDDLDRVTREVQAYSAAGVNNFQQEYRIVSKDGRVRWIDDRTLVERGSAGEVLFYQGIVIDITERKQTEEALRESEARYRNLFEANVHPMWVYDLETLAFLEVNDAAVAHYGFSRDEFLSMTIADIRPPDDVPRLLENISRVGQQPVDRAGIWRHRTKDGRIIDVEITSHILNYLERRAELVLANDITERKQGEEELARSHQTFLTVLDGIDATVYVADMDSHEILFMNKHMIDAFGADLTDRTCYKVFRRESAPCGHCPNDQLLDADGNPTGVFVWETQNPITGKWYINHDRAIQWMDGRMVKLQIATDISKFKELEQERAKIEEQLRQAQKMESVGRLAGGVAHDFNNMLSAILGHAELAMLKLRPAEPVMDDLKAIKKASLRSADLVRQLLAFARKQTVAPKVLDLNDTVAGMLKMLQRLIGEDIDLVWKPGADLWTVRIDPSQIDQILANLCVNARDAIAGVGTVGIQTRNTEFSAAYCAVHPGFSSGEYVMLTVSDNGCGMSEEIMGQIFEPFFTTKEIGKGTGLGLATVYGIVKQNEGFINVQSGPGTGTTFKIYLPRFMGDALNLETKGTAETPRGRGETVLVVEDEASILNVTRAMLEGLGYTVLTAGTPRAALAQAEAHAGDIRLLITDVIMPEMNGRDLSEKIDALVPGLKILFASGYTANVIAHHGVLDKGVQFLPKPFSLKSLAAKVRQALEES
jgi:PAS domain S-box-containing protein